MSNLEIKQFLIQYYSQKREEARVVLDRLCNRSDLLVHQINQIENNWNRDEQNLSSWGPNTTCEKNEEKDLSERLIPSQLNVVSYWDGILNYVINRSIGDTNIIKEQNDKVVGTMSSILKKINEDIAIANSEIAAETAKKESLRAHATDALDGLYRAADMAWQRQRTRTEEKKKLEIEKDKYKSIIDFVEKNWCEPVKESMIEQLCRIGL